MDESACRMIHREMKGISLLPGSVQSRSSCNG
jgi:hypothetical protein